MMKGWWMRDDRVGDMMDESYEYMPGGVCDWFFFLCGLVQGCRELTLSDFRRGSTLYPAYCQVSSDVVTMSIAFLTVLGSMLSLITCSSEVMFCFQRENATLGEPNKNTSSCESDNCRLHVESDSEHRRRS